MKKIIESIRHKPITVGLFSRPGFGKTTLLIQMADMLTAKGEKACIISLEIGEMVIRKKCARLNTDENKFTINDSVDQSFNDIRAFVSKQSNISVIAIDYIQLMKTESASLINKLASEFNVPAIDYIQLMKSESSSRINELASEFNVPVIYCSQLSRELSTHPLWRPTLQDVKNISTTYGGCVILPPTDLFISLWRPINIYHDYDDYDNGGLFPEMIISILRSTVSDISEGYIVNALFDKKTASLMFED